MSRWVGQAMQWDAMGPTCLNPIPSRRLFNLYLNTPRAEQKIHRFHYELIRRTDPWLAKQSFANFAWKPQVLAPNAVTAPATRGSISATDYRYTEFQNQYREIAARLLNPSDSDAFFDVFDRKKLENALKRAHKAPSTNRLKVVFGACAARILLTQGVKAHPVSFPKP